MSYQFHMKFGEIFKLPFVYYDIFDKKLVKHLYFPDQK